MLKNNKLNKMYYLLFIFFAFMLLLLIFRYNYIKKYNTSLNEYFANNPENGKPIKEGQSFFGSLCYHPDEGNCPYYKKDSDGDVRYCGSLVGSSMIKYCLKSNVYYDSQSGFNFYGASTGGKDSKSDSESESKSNNNSSHCFTNHSKVELESGEKIKISDVKLGNKILCYCEKTKEYVYSKVIFIPHDVSFHQNSYIKITTENNLSITMTNDHYIPVYNEIVTTKQAHELKVGDKIKTKKEELTTIKTIENVYDNGLSTVVTDYEFIVVDDIVVSSFGGTMSHLLQYKLATILRYFYKVHPKINESKTLRRIVEMISP